MLSAYTRLGTAKLALANTKQDFGLLHIEREVGMSQVVELASEAEGFAEHGGLPPVAGGASRQITANGVTQNLELDPLAASVHQPVLADAKTIPVSRRASAPGLRCDRPGADALRLANK